MAKLWKKDLEFMCPVVYFTFLPNSDRSFGLRKDNQQFDVILSYMASVRPAIRFLVLKNQNKTNI